MNTNMMLALVALTIVMLVTPAAATAPAPPTTRAPPLPCDFYKHSQACNVVVGCYWSSGDNECKNAVEVTSDALATVAIVLIVVGIVLVLGVVACIVCCCCCGARACMKKDETTVVVQQTPQELKATPQGAAVQQTPQANANPY